MNLIDWFSILVTIIFQGFLFTTGMNFNKKIITFSAIAVYIGMLFFFLSVLLNDVKFASNAFLNSLNFSNFLDKNGRYLGISSNDLGKSKRWFDKYGVSLVFWGRLVPGIRTLISVPAGIELMPLRKFLIWTTFGSLIWVAILTYAGYLFGENYPIIETYLDQIKYVVKPILIAIFLYFFIKILIRFLKKNRT